MKKAYINELSNGEKMSASDYKVKIEYADGSTKEIDVSAVVCLGYPLKVWCSFN